MNRLFTCFVAGLVTLLSVDVVSAQPPITNLPGTPKKTQRIRKLPPGATEAQAKQRIGTVVAQSRAMASERIKKIESDNAKMQQALASENAKISAKINSDPKYAAYAADVQRISNGSGTVKQKAQAIRALAIQNRQLLIGVIKSAGVDRAALETKLKAVVPGVVVNSDLMARVSQRYLAGATSSSAGTAPPSSTPSTQTIVLEPPFSSEEEDADNGGLAASDANADADGGDGEASSDVGVIGVAGGASANATVGELIQVPAGYTRMKVVVKAEMEYSGYAASAAAFSAITCYAAVDVGNTTSSASQFKSAALAETAMAPLAWYSEMEDSESKDYTFEFTVPANNREYFVHAYAGTVGGCGGIGGLTEGQTSSKIKKVTITFSR